MAYDHWYETAAVTVTGSAAWVWRHLTGRISDLEKKIVGQEAFDRHVLEQDAQFRRLYDKHDEIRDEVSDVKAGVARIEGTLSCMNGGGNNG